MKESPSHADLDRFETGAARYAAYLATPEGRLRVDLALANLQDFLPQTAGSLQALDLGCGTGAISVRLGQLGLSVTSLDASQPMLDFAERAARKAGVAERVTLRHGNANQLRDLFDAGSFDVIICHNVLEFVDDPRALLRDAARALRNSSSILSALVRNRAGEVLKEAIQHGDLAAAERNLTAEWANEALYGGRVRLFPGESLQTLLRESQLAVSAERGVRIFADYLPPAISRLNAYKQIFELERNLGTRPEFAAIARYTQCIARRADSNQQARG